MKRLLLGTCALSFLLTGCTQRLVDFTILGAQPLDLTAGFQEPDSLRVEGKDGVYWFVFIPMGSPKMAVAIDRAIESAGPGYDALINGTVYRKEGWYVVTGYSGYRVVGTPVKTAELKARLRREGRDPELALADALFHSSLGISNQQALDALVAAAEVRRESGAGTGAR